MCTVIRIYYLESICDPDHLCFRWTTYDNINGPARPLMYPDQISRYRAQQQQKH